MHVSKYVPIPREKAFHNTCISFHIVHVHQSSCRSINIKKVWSAFAALKVNNYFDRNEARTTESFTRRFRCIFSEPLQFYHLSCITALSITRDITHSGRPAMNLQYI